MTQLAFSYAMLSFALVACGSSVEPAKDSGPPDGKECPGDTECCADGQWVCHTISVPCACPKD